MLVSAEAEVWAGVATRVSAKTPEGDIGILRGHEPMLALIGEAPVRIATAEGEVIHARAAGGFLSVSDNTVTIFADHAELQ